MLICFANFPSVDSCYVHFKLSARCYGVHSWTKDAHNGFVPIRKRWFQHAMARVVSQHSSSVSMRQLRQSLFRKNLILILQPFLTRQKVQCKQCVEKAKASQHEGPDCSIEELHVPQYSRLWEWNDKQSPTEASIDLVLWGHKKKHDSHKSCLSLKSG